MKDFCYSVKIATFTVEKFANSQYESLKRKGYAVYINTSGSFMKKKTYTVLVGSFKSQEEAEKMAETIRCKERLKTSVILKK